MILNLWFVVTQVVPHSLATHHHVFRGPRGSDVHVPGTEPSPVGSVWGSDVSPGYMPTGSVGTSACSPYYHPLRSRSGRNNAELSVERPLLLRAKR